MTPALPGPPPTRPRLRRWAVPGLVVLVAGVVAGWWFLRPAGPPPPDVPPGASPEVAAAIEEARAEVRRDRRDAAPWGRLGLVLTAHGFDDPAAACFQQAHQLDPADDRWPYLLGLYYQTDGRDPVAAVGFLEAAAACPHGTAGRGAAARLRLAEQYLATGRLGDAERVFRDHLGREPADARARLGLGVTLLAADRPAEAAEQLREATGNGFTRRQALTNLAVASRLAGDAAAAARYEEAVARASDDLPHPDPFLADVAAHRVGWRGGYEEAAELEQAGRLRDALPVLIRLAENPAETRAAVALGRVLAVLGHRAEAERHLRAACTRDPAHVQAALLLATVLYDQAKAETADPVRKSRLLRASADAAGRAVGLKPDLAMAHYTRAVALRDLGDVLAALPHFRAAAECRPEVGEIQMGLVEALADVGLADEAAARLPAAEKVMPADAPRLAAVRRRLGTAPAP